jgi:hypothetical protein
LRGGRGRRGRRGDGRRRRGRRGWRRKFIFTFISHGRRRKNIRGRMMRMGRRRMKFIFVFHGRMMRMMRMGRRRMRGMRGMRMGRRGRRLIPVIQWALGKVTIRSMTRYKASIPALPCILGAKDRIILGWMGRRRKGLIFPAFRYVVGNWRRRERFVKTIGRKIPAIILSLTYQDQTQQN